jgi:hypothetical protein
MVYWTPYPWYFDPLPMVYQPHYPWYFDPTTHGISNPLSMLYWPPYPWYIEPPSMVFWPPWSNSIYECPKMHCMHMDKLVFRFTTVFLYWGKSDVLHFLTEF